MTTLIRRSLACPLALLILLATGGCLTYEESDLQVSLREGGESGSFTYTYVNLSSDDSLAAGEDFRDLISAWKGDEFLLEGVSDGYYITDRRLWLERGQLMGRETAIFSDLAKTFDFVKVEGDTVVWELGNNEVLLTTNGTAVSRDSVQVVLWPRGARELRVRLRNREFRPVASLADSFAVWQRAHPGQ